MLLQDWLPSPQVQGVARGNKAPLRPASHFPQGGQEECACPLLQSPSLEETAHRNDPGLSSAAGPGWHGQSHKEARVRVKAEVSCPSVAHSLFTIEGTKVPQ